MTFEFKLPLQFISTINMHKVIYDNIFVVTTDCTEIMITLCGYDVYCIAVVTADKTEVSYLHLQKTVQLKPS